ncbi:hypothetical protein NL676_028449 [Syzygium grande]|nr:hypothetical protein NL676_028449 [Syzygium grande]
MTSIWTVVSHTFFFVKGVPGVNAIPKQLSEERNKKKGDSHIDGPVPRPRPWKNRDRRSCGGRFASGPRPRAHPTATGAREREGTGYLPRLVLPPAEGRGPPRIPMGDHRGARVPPDSDVSWLASSALRSLSWGEPGGGGGNLCPDAGPRTQTNRDRLMMRSSHQRTRCARFALTRIRSSLRAAT